MKMRTLIAASLLTGVLAPTVAAQEESSERGQLWRVRMFEVAPADVIPWVTAVRKIVAAAEAANLEQQWGWTVWVDFPRYYVSSPVTNMAAFDDPDAWTRQFEGTPGQATLQEAMQELQPLHARVVSDEIYEHEMDWSYLPAEPAFDGASGGAELSEFYILPGKAEEFQAIVGEAIDMLSQIGYPYTMNGYRIIMGEGSKTVFVTFWDNREAYYGVNSQDRLLEQHGMTEAWQGLVARMLGTISDFKTRMIDYEPPLSHWDMN
jgi:hypothetical protein